MLFLREHRIKPSHLMPRVMSLMVVVMLVVVLVMMVMVPALNMRCSAKTRRLGKSGG